MDMVFRSTKRFGHEVGLSACFRQWRAHDSHCSKLHGYALAFTFTFETDTNGLDERNWVVDFGGLKSLKSILEDSFDHKLLVADDDPHLPRMLDLQAAGVADVVIVPATGCERFAEMVYDVAETWLRDAGFAPRCWLVSVECSEHGANSAIYRRA